MVKDLLGILETEDPSAALTAVVISALDEQSPGLTLSSVVGYLLNEKDVSGYLDPLTLLTHLIPSADPGVEGMLEVVRERCSSKEVMIACEENLERVGRMVGDSEEWEWEGEEEGEGKEVSPSIQILRLIRMFTVISTIPLRRKSALSLSFIPELAFTIQRVGGRSDGFSKTEGRDGLWYSAELVERVMDLVEKREEGEGEWKDILNKYISTTIDTLGTHIQASLAKRAFGVCFPRFGGEIERLDEGWERGDEVVRKLESCFSRIRMVPVSVFSGFVLFAHSTRWESRVGLTKYLPFILTSIQTNTLLDESLAVLLLSFSPSHSHSHSLPPSSPSFFPLLSLLPVLSSTHPDPFIRHCAFRVLGEILSVVPGLVQVEVLVDLVGVKVKVKAEEEREGLGSKMRVEAIGLVKDAVLRALERDRGECGGEVNVLASPRFLQVFAPVLFVLEDSIVKLDREDLERNETITELTRLGEVLALYYVLVMRDARNRTGIRDLDNRANFERTILAPLRVAVPRWIGVVQGGLRKEEEVFKEKKEEEKSHTSGGLHSHSHSHSHALAPLVSLQIGLERIDGMWELTQSRLIPPDPDPKGLDPEGPRGPDSPQKSDVPSHSGSAMERRFSGV
ncbi:hypothetical protein F5050DRAFT_1812187 [Lentinula boryana]|uniref:ARM repeat-containing protein n=1 Tax=Lentinula boryana TaxID=40481 RepID=A0ABQ8PZ45_9AGAR|nr:hypothetical protein F5050DRAFT_1812187 [Lentinula boryana]